jgi:murein DD-endopeptidase MepM/ murein hydrolase activator NlpD
MLRFVLALVLLSLVAVAAFYAGRVTASRPIAILPPRQDDTGNRARILEPGMNPGPPPQVQPEIPAPQSPPMIVQSPAPAPSVNLHIGLPLANLKAADIQDTFDQARSGDHHRHEATDIMAPRGTPVLAVDSGLVKKLFNSKAGGLTIYQFDAAERYCFYYAHLDRYGAGIREGLLVKRGDVIAYVGSTGNADPDAPHLHFAIFELGPEKQWWKGTPINPYPLLMRALK